MADPCSSEPVASQAKFLGITREGRTHTMVVDAEMAEILCSDKTNSKAKDLIVQMLISQMPAKIKEELQTSSALLLSPFEEDSACSLPAASTSSSVLQDSQGAPLIHSWKRCEEQLLINLRHERQDAFLDTKNHTLLWEEITQELEKSGCKVSPVQAMNKYASLKKRWKKVLNMGTKCERKLFKYSSDFDKIYGTKTRMMPSAVVDSMDQSRSHYISVSQNHQEVKNSQIQEAKVNHGQETEGLSLSQIIRSKRQLQVANDKSGDQEAKDRVKSKKRCSGTMTDQFQEIRNLLEKFHKEKMSRLDRLLDLYEKDINHRQNST